MDATDRRQPRHDEPRRPPAWLDGTVFEAAPGLFARGRVACDRVACDRVACDGVACDRVACDGVARLPAGARIGPFAVIEPLGEGGMGSVYLARRADDQYRQRVAIKLIRRDLVSPGSVRRFRRERQILADLEHPSIARMLGGDVTDDGTPYLVMEHVVGEPIDAFCVRKRLSVAARLDLFREVCAAVRHAHRRLVLHCDLKTINVLVTPEGTPKLLDFGIARLLGDAGTAVGGRRMTPAFASPEQVREERLTVASDVYALGVMLYRLLAGRPPYDLPGRPSAVRRVIGEVRPPPPSTVATSPRARRRLAGDLDAIVAKALEKDPRLRYASVEQLDDDLIRHRIHRPVLARRGGLVYRAGRLLRRQRLAFAAALLIASALLAGTWLADRERRRAEVARQRAEAVAGFLEGLFLDADSAKATSPGSLLDDRSAQSARLLLLDEGARRVETELADQPAVQARLLQRIGDAYRNLGSLERAAPLLERALALQRHRNDGDRDAGTEPEVASVLESVCLLALSRGALEQAEARCREALAIRADLGARGALGRASALGSLALVLREQGRLDDAEARVRESLEIRRAALPDSHPDITTSLNNLAVILQARERAAEAEPVVRDVLRRKIARHGPAHLQVVNAHNNLASVLQDRGKQAEAERQYRDALAAGNALTEAHPLVATVHHNLGTLLARSGRADEAVKHLETALATDRAILGESHLDVARDLHTLAVARYRQGDANRAERHLDEALDLHERSGRLGHPAYRKAVFDRVAIHRALGDDERARSRLERALGVWKARPPRDAWAPAQAEALVGGILLKAGRLDEAEPYLLRGVAGLRASDPGPTGRLTRSALACLVALLDAKGDARASSFRADLPAEAPACPDTG